MGPRTVRRGGLGLVAAAVLLIAVGCSGSAASPSAASDPKVSTITVGAATGGGPVPDGFLGLSIEYRGLEEYLGKDPAALNPGFIQLLRNLAPGRRFVLRIGGDSSDWVWWPVAHMAQPRGIRLRLDARWLQIAHAFAQTLDPRMIFGINLEADSARLAGAEARAFLSRVGSKWIDAFEVGNEPELYGVFGWYTLPNGNHVLGRPSGYNVSDYLADFSRISAAIPHVPLAGPSSGAKTWLAQLGTILSRERRVGIVTVHAYPTKQCGHTDNVTISQLLSDAATNAITNQVSAWNAVAHRRGLPLRVDEMNSVSCGGRKGVSDAFAPALWALNQLFALVKVGVDGVNFHSVPIATNRLISSQLVGAQWQNKVQPEYYGLMMFAQAAPAGARLLRVSGASAAGIEAWATRVPGGQLHVVLINKSHQRHSLSLKITGAHGSASLERLLAPSLAATGGVTLGGQSLGSQTTTGLLAGNSTASTVSPSGGAYAVSMPPASAAMLTIG